MKKDIVFEKVTDVAMAIVPEQDESGNEEFMVYLVNLKGEQLDGVIISSKGYGQLDGKSVKTSTLRHFFEKVEPNDFVKIEWIPSKLFGLNNEYWVSFWHNGYIYDKQYVFVTESIVKNNFTEIPLLGKRGVMIK